MLFSWFANRRRRRILAEPFPTEWLAHLASNMRHYALLEPDKQEIVRQVTQVFVAEKHWAGGGGLAVTDEMKVTVAAQASLLVLGFSEPYYFDHLPSIILHPRRFTWPRRFQNQWGIVDNREHSGEAWSHGPIVLSWEEVVACGRNELSGYNVAIHEFAHHLDALNGEFDGEPPLGRQQWKDWDRVTEAE
jgi:Mlc titration factor MtfA (ptsG expression regulator)